jgi:hypothetical protein
MKWLYERTPDNSARFVLGVDGANPLVCFGLNPSTAVPGKLDQTVTRVQEVSRRNGFDGFIMLNVYPRRDTVPKDLPDAFELALKEENERHIAATLSARPLTVYAAWGGIIATKTYLQPLLRDILDLPDVSSSQWVRRGELAKGVHPRHPLYVSYDQPLIPFDAAAYAKSLRTTIA